MNRHKQGLGGLRILYEELGRLLSPDEIPVNKEEFFMKIADSADALRVSARGLANAGLTEGQIITRIARSAWMEVFGKK
ncbi:hypothetical protein HY623_02885 [Candidatus Uhrbacteria bacterium]|nr:hypothetical protein [Candidatus Uhrbacteria bacterium]